MSMDISEIVDWLGYEPTPDVVSVIEDNLPGDFDELSVDGKRDCVSDIIHNEFTEEEMEGIEVETSDVDNDGDTDEVTIKKTDPVDNNKASEGLAGDMTPEEELMLKLAGRNDAPHDEGLAGETTPEEDLMLKITNPKPTNGLSGETTPEEDNMTNMIARMLSDRRW